MAQVWYAYVMSNHFLPHTHYANYANVFGFAYKSFLELQFGVLYLFGY